MNNVNILFYSNFCDGSKLLISMMDKENLTRLFHKICTDNNPNIPAAITVTPVIIIKGVPTPYVAGDAFTWLSKIKQYKMNVIFNRVSSAQQQYLKNINNNLMPNNDCNVLSFSKSEMEGMSDIFAYLHEDSGMPHTFVAYDNLGKENILTPPLENGSFKISNDKSYKIDSEKSKKLCALLETERKNSDKYFKQNILNFRSQYHG